MKRIMDIILAKVKDQKGVTAIEYGLIAVLIAIMIIGGVTIAGTNLSAAFNTVATALTPGV